MFASAVTDPPQADSTGPGFECSQLSDCIANTAVRAVAVAVHPRQAIRVLQGGKAALKGSAGRGRPSKQNMQSEHEKRVGRQAGDRQAAPVGTAGGAVRLAGRAVHPIAALSPIRGRRAFS